MKNLIHIYLKLSLICIKERCFLDNVLLSPPLLCLCGGLNYICVDPCC